MRMLKAEEHDNMLKALRAVLLFHGTVVWDEQAQQEWLSLTGTSACNTKTLCDTVRTALGEEPSNT